MKGGETLKHAGLKMLALQWACEQGMTLAAPEVNFPHRRFRVDAAACCPERKVPSRAPVTTLTSVLKVAAIFECKQARADLIRDNKQRELSRQRLKTLEARRLRLESLLHLHLPHLANSEALFPEFDSYRLREYRHNGYQKLMKHLAAAKKCVATGTKFDRLISYGIANLHFLVIEEDLIETHEVPMGWGLLVRTAEKLQLVKKPLWKSIGIEHQLVFLQRIAARKA